jgi:hypothetical protein
MLSALGVVIAAVTMSAPAIRMMENPILTPQSSPTIGANLNGPSLIRVPAWVSHPLGRYYLYFAHHGGKFIRLAYSDALTGPWKVHEPGTLKLSEASACNDHIASPDLHVDDALREIHMYFHCPTGGTAEGAQRTFLATSKDGLHFAASATDLGPFYFRVFRWHGFHYAIARGGVFLRSRDGRSAFQEGPALFGTDSSLMLRHAAVDLKGDSLLVYYSRIGDTPERILLSRIQLTPDWKTWRASEPEEVLRPEREYEGATLPLIPSATSEAEGRVRQLRDPGIFKETGKTYLLYSVAGESGIAIAVIE